MVQQLWILSVTLLILNSKHMWQCLTRVVFTPQSPPREGSQGELTPANSQTRMSTNMWGGSPLQRLHADSADNTCGPWGGDHPIIRQHQPSTAPPPVCLLKTETTHDIKTLMFWSDLCYPHQMIWGGGNHLSVWWSGDSDKKKMCFDESSALKLYITGWRFTLLCLQIVEASLTETRF